MVCKNCMLLCDIFHEISLFISPELSFLYADLYCVQYSKEKLEAILTSDIHSLARLRVNGIVMNTDMWYDLYDVNRDNLLYLPPEKRTYIW